jgi:hypothetical protein
MAHLSYGSPGLEGLERCVMCWDPYVEKVTGGC